MESHFRAINKNTRSIEWFCVLNGMYCVLNGNTCLFCLTASQFYDQYAEIDDAQNF